MKFVHGAFWAALFIGALALPALAHDGNDFDRFGHGDHNSGDSDRFGHGDHDSDPRIGHVFVITLENEGYEVTFGPNSKAPYLSQTLTAKGVLLTQYSAPAMRASTIISP